MERLKGELLNEDKNRVGRLEVREDNLRVNWKEYFKDLHNVETEKRVVVNMSGFEGARRSNMFG